MPLAGRGTLPLSSSVQARARALHSTRQHHASPQDPFAALPAAPHPPGVFVASEAHTAAGSSRPVMEETER